jgi:hypothetical protein
VEFMNIISPILQIKLCYTKVSKYSTFLFFDAGFLNDEVPLLKDRIK